ncbi:MAG TPA: LCP family protein [Mycobacteriales bacterium]|nr:LCP family protein [Mycobacteriales bacterium]
MAGKRRAGRRSRKEQPDLLGLRRAPTLLQPTQPELVIQPQLTRAEERRLRKRAQRRRLGLAGGIGVGALAIALIVTLVLGVRHVVTTSGGASRTQTTLLLQLQAPGGAAVGSVLLAADPSTQLGLELLIPSRLITDVCGYGSQNFGSVLALPNGAADSRAALSSVLGGVTIDGSWVMPESVLTTLVNQIGGIDVDVDTNVIQRLPGGAARILVAAGVGQHLNGMQALQYATYHPAREGAAGVLARLQAVLDATLQALPKTQTGVEALLRQLPKTAQSTIGVSKLADLLTKLAAYQQTEAGVFPTDLPVVTIDAGSSQPSYRADESPSGIKQLVDGHLANSVPEDVNKQHATVYLLNGLGVPGLVGTACPKLVEAGFTYVGSRNAPRFSNARSEIDIFRDSDVGQARTLAKALGLPASDVRRSVYNQTVAKFIVILGSDYRP